MSMAHLGPSFDIHTGGIDLVFPHHEDEIAQSEAATGKPFVGTWLHCAHLRSSGSKMARSIGNIALAGELFAAGVSPRALRYALIAVHYRASLNHSDESLAAAGASLERLDALVGALSAYREPGPDDSSLPETLVAARAAFGAALDDDLNISEALAALFDFVREVNRRIEARGLSTDDAGRALELLFDLDQVLGVLPDPADDLEPEILTILDERSAARTRKDWAASDRLRDELLARGIAVEDTRDGQRWRRLAEVTHG